MDKVIKNNILKIILGIYVGLLVIKKYLLELLFNILIVLIF